MSATATTNCCRFLSALGAALAILAVGSPALAQADLESTMSQARAFELKRDWPAALKLYDSYLERSSEAPSRERAYAHLARGSTRFFAGEIAGSVADFDQVAALQPKREPELWQRGISHFYLGRFEDCIRQFELHRTVNPNDVENPVWHLLCNVEVLGSLEQAQAAILPVGPDQRSPMKEVYELFRGTSGVEDVRRAVASGSSSARFYAHLYLGLWFEIVDDDESSLAELRRAVALGLPGYMPEVARVHLEQRTQVSP